MAIQILGARPMRRGAMKGLSVREICLLGAAPPDSSWAEGATVEWEGRVYRVAATQGVPAGGAAQRYVHLTPAPDDF